MTGPSTGLTVAGSEQLTTGIVVAPVATLCGRAWLVKLKWNGQTGGQVSREIAVLGRIILRGYVVDAN